MGWWWWWWGGAYRAAAEEVGEVDRRELQLVAHGVLRQVLGLGVALHLGGNEGGGLHRRFI